MRWVVGGLIFVNAVALIWQIVANSADEPAPSPPPVTNTELANAPSLKLLSELDERTLLEMRRSKAVARTRQRSTPEPEHALCTLVGPFSKMLRAEYFVERLNALELQSSVQELEIPGELGYWVYLPSQGSRKQAFNQLRELQAKGIDSYVIPRGELENGISFGMFSKKNLAEQRLEDMRSQGYDAQLKEVARSYKEIWVVLRPGQVGQLSAEAWQELLIDDEEDKLDRRQNYCPPVASP